jgi:hypothetical protein
MGNAIQFMRIVTGELQHSRAPEYARIDGLKANIRRIRFRSITRG